MAPYFCRWQEGGTEKERHLQCLEGETIVIKKQNNGELQYAFKDGNILTKEGSKRKERLSNGRQ